MTSTFKITVHNTAGVSFEVTRNFPFADTLRAARVALGIYVDQPSTALPGRVSYTDGMAFWEADDVRWTAVARRVEPAETDAPMGPQCAACGDESCTSADAHHTVTTFTEDTETPAAPLASVTERTMILKDIAQSLADMAQRVVVSAVLDSAEGRVSVWTTSQTETPNYMVSVRPCLRLLYVVDSEAGTATWAEPMDVLVTLHNAIREMAAHQG